MSMVNPQQSVSFFSWRNKYIGVLSLLAVVTFLAWPTTTAQCPTWEVHVVDQAGQPVERMTVRLSYQNYSAESESHSEDLQTDAKGYVLFHRQNLKVPRIQRILAVARSATGGVHTSFGPHAWVWTFGNGLEGTAVNDGKVTDWTGTPSRMVSKIVAKAGDSVIRTY
jgi:hypothetical protein